MSYDLTIRADRNYSQFVALGPLAEFIGNLPDVQANGPSGFLLKGSHRWMNISLETANEEGDSVAAHEDGRSQVNCIRLSIPYEYLGDAPEQDYFPVGKEIADLLGWQLYDAQTGEDLAASTPVNRDRGAFYREVRRALGLDETSPGGASQEEPSKGKKKPNQGKRRR
jgi:hypothetical protein